MPGTNKKHTTAVEDYFTDLRSIRANVWTSKLGGYQVLKIGSPTENKRSSADP